MFNDPATFARTAFIEALERAGVTVTGDPVATNPTESLPPRGRCRSPAVRRRAAVAAALGGGQVRHEDQLQPWAADDLLPARGGGWSDDCERGMPKAAAIWKATRDWTPCGVVLIDGSGLAGNFVTPNNQVELQTIMAKRPDAEAWRDTLPILGVDGSLATVQANGPSAGKVSGKTGTLAAGDGFNDRYRLPVKALGGYIDTEGGRHFAFAVFSTNSLYPDINGIFQANDDVGKVVSTIQQAY